MFPLLILAAAAVALPPTPAPPPPPATAGAVEHLHEIVVEAIRNCPKAKGDEIVVCSRDRGLAEGYRIPRMIRDGGWNPQGSTDSVSRERHRLMEGGEAGTGSCSATGPGGWTGCLLRDWEHKRQQNGYQ